MCRKAEETTFNNMVTPTKVKHHNHHNQKGSHRGGGKGWTPPPNKQRGTASSPIVNGNTAFSIFNGKATFFDSTRKREIYKYNSDYFFLLPQSPALIRTRDTVAQ